MIYFKLCWSVCSSLCIEYWNIPNEGCISCIFCSRSQFKCHIFYFFKWWVFKAAQFESSSSCTYYFNFFYRYNPELSCGIKPGEDEKKSQINLKRGTASGRIVGGNFADLGEWPWQVLLQWEIGTAIYKALHNKTFCAGAILLKHCVLTAPHCKLNGKFNSLTVIIHSEMKIISNIFWKNVCSRKFVIIVTFEKFGLNLKNPL